MRTFARRRRQTSSMPYKARSQHRLRQWRSALAVVPDDALRAVIVELLAQEHFAAFDVETIVEAKYLLLSRSPELVVLDPGVTRVDEVRAFLGELEGSERLRSVIVLTDQPAIAHLSAEAQVTCLLEPFDLDELAYEVQRATTDAERRAR
jgi:DNA-binding NtrC family response regulator